MTNAPIPRRPRWPRPGTSKSLYAFFDEDWNLALAAYNSGPGRVQGAIRRARTSDYWKLTAGTRFLPRETREYVPMIMAAMIVAKNPTLYGFEVGTANRLAYERVTVPNALDLKIVAEWINVSVDELRELNPELRRTTTPMGEHELKVPLGTAPTLRARLATIDSSLFVQFTFHTVKRGETIATIARRHKITQAELRLANDLTPRSRIRANQSLMIPQRTANALPSATTRSHGGRAGRDHGSLGPADLPRAAGRHPLQNRAPVRHDRGRDQAPQSPSVRHHQRRRSADRSTVGFSAIQPWQKLPRRRETFTQTRSTPAAGFLRA